MDTERRSTIYVESINEMILMLSDIGLAMFQGYAMAMNGHVEEPDVFTNDLRAIAATNGIDVRTCVNALDEIGQYMIHDRELGSWKRVLVPLYIRDDENGDPMEMVIYAFPIEVEE